MAAFFQPRFAAILALFMLQPMCNSVSKLTPNDKKFVFGSCALFNLVNPAVPLSIEFRKWLYDFFFPERCSNSWIDFNEDGFKNALRTKVHGQPLVGLSGVIQDHWNDKNQPSKALLLSLHGPPGTGKNYVSSILITHLFEKDAKSKFYHLLSGTVHFPHANQVEIYKDQIQQWVRGNVSLCPKSVFVFDEVNKMPTLLLDSIKPFVDYHKHIDGVDYRRAIFIFLSNSGSKMIVKYMYDRKRQGRDRSDVYAELDNKLPKYLYSEDRGSLHNSELLQHHLVSRFIPFLPLERPHVISCIKDFLLDKNPYWLHKPGFIDRVVNELVFEPKKDQFFSSTGCKRVADKTMLRISIEMDSEWEKKQGQGWGKEEF